MALKAGRVGVAPDQVDEFGNINSEATSGYTKQEADTKFETQSHASSTYETKSHADSTYQKKTLELPLETLLGSKLTVEDSLDALNEIQKTRQPKTLSVPIELLNGSETTVEGALDEMGSELSLLSTFIKNGELSSADDLDTIVNSGVYAWADSVPAHAPGNSNYCTLIHTKAYGGVIYRAIQLCIRSISNACTIYARKDSGSGWSAWFKVDLTEVN